MKKIRILHIEFDDEIAGHELPAFRGAIAAKAGKENIIFHNHLSDTKVLYAYPLIQYKIIHRHPSIMCIEHGVDEVHKFFEKKDWSLNISGRTLNMKIAKLQMNQFNMQIWESNFDYSIRNWMALNQENYKKYNEIESLTERVTFLEKTLTANIISFAKGIDWTIDKNIEVKITDLQGPKMVTFKDQKMTAFDATFKTNVFIPNFIGLGKGVSLGFGVIAQKRERKEINNIHNQ